MHPAITKLLSISGEAISGYSLADQTVRLDSWGPRGSELAVMLNQKNGFYAFESSLLIRPMQFEGVPLGLLQWNSSELWIGKYHQDLTNLLFFAEDVFGNQFCIQDDKICTFDPETGLLEAMSSSFDEWGEELLSNYEFRTGYPLAHAWQVAHHPLQAGVRLLPKTPFVCGGKYEIENIYPLNDVEGMLFRSSIANQIHDLPDGSEIILEIMPPESKGNQVS